VELENARPGQVIRDLVDLVLTLGLGVTVTDTEFGVLLSRIRNEEASEF